MVGVNTVKLAETVRSKAAKARGYRWERVDERWLLICATGCPVVSSGPPAPSFVNWEAPAIVAACGDSNFDRVFFYEQRHGWCQPVWP